MKKFVRFSFIGLVSLVGLACYTLVVFLIGYGQANTHIRGTGEADAELTVYNLLKLVNEERSKVGAPPLALSQELNQSAQMKADDMHQNNYFDHINPTTGKEGNTYIDEVMPGRCVYTNENLTDNATQEDNTSFIAINSFIKSPAHYTEMVSPQYEFIGFGIAGTKVVQHFCDLR